MTEWGVFSVVAAMLTFALAVGAPVLKLNKSINVLTITVQHLKELLDEMKRDNAKSHESFQDQLDEHEERLSRHSKKIAVLEERQK